MTFFPSESPICTSRNHKPVRRFPPAPKAVERPLGEILLKGSVASRLLDLRALGKINIRQLTKRIGASVQRFKHMVQSKYLLDLGQKNKHRDYSTKAA